MQAGNVGPGFQASGLVLPHHPTLASRRAKRKSVHWQVALFLIALAVPWVFYFGTLRMSVYRIVLLVMFLPCLVMWVAGKGGRIRLADIAVLLYVFWTTLSLTLNHGFDLSIKSAGIICIETIGPYMLARCYIRDADDFYNVTKLLFRIVVFLLPFAAFECFSGQNVSRELFATVLPTINEPPLPARSGLTRVTSVFDHPILFGTFTGSILALVYLVLGYRKNFFQRASLTGIVGVTSIMSLSSGPLGAVVVQSALLCWNGLLGTIRFRWKLLIAIVASIVLVIELVARRSALEILVSYVLFDPGSYWGRVVIWTFATESVMNHPLYGTGLNEWQRPDWLMSSIDSYWLFQAATYGLPAALFMALAFFSIFLPVSFKKGLDARLAAYRTGFLITMTAFFVVAWTVHFWDAVYVLFLFLLGSGVWMLDVKPRSRSALEAPRV